MALPTMWNAKHDLPAGDIDSTLQAVLTTANGDFERMKSEKNFHL